MNKPETQSAISFLRSLKWDGKHRMGMLGSKSGISYETHQCANNLLKDAVSQIVGLGKDTGYVLAGRQAIGKSRLLQCLCGPRISIGTQPFRPLYQDGTSSEPSQLITECEANTATNVFEARKRHPLIAFPMIVVTTNCTPSNSDQLKFIEMVKTPDFDWITRNRTQLWAEAFHIATQRPGGSDGQPSEDQRSSQVTERETVSPSPNDEGTGCPD